MRKLYIIALPRGDTKINRWDARFTNINTFAGSIYPCCYYIFENESGVLMWERVFDEDEEKEILQRDTAMSFTLPKSGYYTGEEVYPEEAEIITGLCDPVCMDRLRELVHES